MYEKMKKQFIKYANTFDISENSINRKINHTFRVVDYCESISKSLELSESDIELAKICGLLHDIARFKQWTKYQTYCDDESFDHGNEAINIINNLKIIDDYKEKNIILKAVKNHNKIRVEDGLNEREMLFANIVRDADKIDIMITQCNEINDNKPLNNVTIYSFVNQEMCSNRYIVSDSDQVLRMLSWIFDFNFNYSIKYLKEQDIFNKKFELLKLHNNNVEDIEKVLNDKLKEMT